MSVLHCQSNSNYFVNVILHDLQLMMLWMVDDVMRVDEYADYDDDYRNYMKVSMKQLIAYIDRQPIGQHRYNQRHITMLMIEILDLS